MGEGEGGGALKLDLGMHGVRSVTVACSGGAVLREVKGVGGWAACRHGRPQFASLLITDRCVGSFETSNVT